MEAMESSNLSERQVVNHGCSQSSPTPNARSVFVPKLPPRPRQRGALPRTFAEPASFPQRAGASPSQLNAAPRLFKESSSSSSQQQVSLKALIPPMEEQTLPQQPADASMPSMMETWQGPISMQHGQGGSLHKRKNPTPLQRGQLPNVGKFSRSWHRVSPQEPSHQRGVSPSPQGQNFRPRQRGAIYPLQAPSAHTSSAPGPPSAQPSVAIEQIVCPPFLQMRSSFSEMWFQLEGAIQNRERMLMGMKAEMEKAISEGKILKDDALKEREEVEAKKVGVRENMEIIIKQAGKLKSVREGFEQISTDLSVQVAELNHLLQQAQEQQRVLKVLESLKDHRDASNDKNSFMFKNLHDCEVKLATMERELVGSKQTSELLEKAALKWTSDLEDIEAGGGPTNYLAKNASSSPPVASSPMFQDTAKTSRASGLKAERETLAHAAALKQPKLELVS